MLLFEIGYELVFYLVMNVRFHYLLEKWNFCVYHWYGNFSLFLTKLLKEFYTRTIVTGVNLYWKVFMQGLCFLKYSLLPYFGTWKNLFIEWFKADPCMLENCFEGTWYRTPIANSGTVSPWRVMVNLELAWYSWVSSHAW